MTSPSVRLRRFACLLAGVALAVLATSVPANNALQDGAKAIVLVPPFENLSKQHDWDKIDEADGTDPKKPRRQYKIDRYTEAPRALFEDAIVNTKGVSVVERKRVDTLLQEVEFGQRSGLVDAEKAIKLGKQLGANRIVIGTIANISEETKKFKGYGIQTENTVVSADLRVRMLEIQTGEVVYSKKVIGAVTYSKSTFGETKSSDRHFAAVKAAVDEISKDDKFKSALRGEKPVTEAKQIVVEFAPKPDNCNIEIDGKYVGGSPHKEELLPGIEYKIRIAKSGYKEWTAVIVPKVGLKITPELEASK
jgi:curli biogenesis system outer membrane secretion channel CsgG